MYSSFLRFWEAAVESYTDHGPPPELSRTTPQRFMIGLAVLTSTDAFSERSLAHRLGINRRTVHNTLLDAERMGWAEKTDNGWVSTKLGRDRAVARLSDIFQRLNEHEVRALRDALDRSGRG
ncbi:MAG: hypothetical protein AAGK37_08195 [Pseudomonadota bacterium]